MKVSFVWLSPTLTALGKKFGIDMHYFFRHSTLVMLGQIVSLLRGVITGYLVARFFDKEVYGQYQFILSFIGIVGFFGLSGLAHSVTRAWARGDAFSLARITFFQLKFCLIGSMVLLGCIPFLGIYGRAELWPLFLAAAILFPLPSITMVHFGAYTVGKARFDLSLRASFVWSLLTILATLAILIFYQSALLMLIVSMAIPPVVYWYYSRAIKLPEPTLESADNTRSIIRYGYQLTLASLPTDIVWYMDKLLISHYFGLAQLATFSISLIIPEQVKMFTKQLLPVTFAKQAGRADTLDLRRKLLKVVMTGTALFALGVALYIAICPIIIPWLFPQYDASQVSLLTSIAAITIITNPSTLLLQHLEAQGFIQQIRWSQWSSAILFALSLFVLIPTYGLLGAILARGVFRFSLMTISWWFMLRMPLR